MLSKKNKKTLIKLILTTIAVLYFALPPYNKIAQIGYSFNNLSLLYCQTGKNDLKDEYIFHRNNAIYLARLNNKKGALLEFDKTINTFPTNLPEEKLYQLYRERAEINLYFHEYKAALNDLARIKDPSFQDRLKIAMLLKMFGKRKNALSYCNSILDMDIHAYSGYACLADVYADANKYEAAVAIYDLLIDRTPGKAKYYMERAKYKELAGDTTGAEADKTKASELIPTVFINESSITEEAINPKSVHLSVIQS